MMLTYAGRYRKYLFGMLFLFLGILFSLQSVSAANMITRARNNAYSTGTFEETEKGKRYVSAEGTFLKKQWACIDGNVYCFDKYGYAKKGWFSYGKSKYYADENSVIRYNCTIESGGALYYLKKNGRRAENCWVKIGGEKYFVNEEGVRAAYPASGVKYLFVGDSRTHGMALSMPSQRRDTAFIYKDGAGYDFLIGEAQKQLTVYLKESPAVKVIMAYGVNDLGNIEQYLSYYKTLQEQYPKASFYYMSINPITYSNAWVSNKKIKAFNRILKKEFPKQYVATYNYLKKKGFETWDGLHYTFETYQKLYKYVRKKVRTM